jgi:hypothetical protein
VRRPGIWKRAWKGAASSFLESMLATNPVAYADYRRCKAGVDDQMTLACEGPVMSASASAALAAVLRRSVIHDQASKELAAL